MASKLLELTKKADVDGVKSLLQSGAVDVNTALTDGGEKAIHLAALLGNSSLLEALLTVSAAPNVSNNHGVKPLHLSARKGNTECSALLLDQGADVNSSDKQGWTPLHYASYHGHLASVSHLLKAGAQLSSTTVNKLTALHLASGRGHTQVILHLIQSGAKLDVKDINGLTPLSLIPLADKSAELNDVDHGSEHQKQLGNDLKELLNREQFSDITFQVDGLAIFAHKIILSTRSRYFQNRFKTENTEKELKIKDVRHSIFMSFLEYIYSGQVKDLENGTLSSPSEVHFLLDLMSVSYLYQSELLTSYCERVLKKNLSSDNIISVLKKLKTLNLPPSSLGTYCNEFLVRNIGDLVDTESFYQITREDFNAILRNINIEKRKEEDRSSLKKELSSTSLDQTANQSRESPPAETFTAPLKKVLRNNPTTVEQKPTIAAPVTNDSEQLKAVKPIFMQIYKERDSWPFLTPVDPQALNIPDYFTFIKHPMDLGTIKKKLRQYRTLAEFVLDVRLVFHNALLYNLPRSNIYNMAERLLTLFEKKYSSTIGPLPPDITKAIMALPSTTNITLDLIKSIASASQPEQPISAQTQQPQQQIQQTPVIPHQPPVSQPQPPVSKKRKSEVMEKEKTPSKKERDAKEKETQASRERERQQKEIEEKKTRPMSFDEKQSLGVKINSLEADQVEKVVEITNTGKSKDIDSDNAIEIDLDDLNTETLRVLEAYVDSCLTQNQKQQAVNQPPPKAEPKPTRKGRRASKKDFDDDVGSDLDDSSASDTNRGRPKRKKKDSMQL